MVIYWGRVYTIDFSVILKVLKISINMGRSGGGYLTKYYSTLLELK